jgi:polyhydroxybutyrate depolymerase
MPEQTGMDAAADRRGLIVAYPDGPGHWPFARTWHTGRCCALALEKDVDDVAFIRALITDLRAKLAMDSSRIHVTGFSDGAMMTFRLGCELADQVAAITVVAGRMPDVHFRPARPLPVLGFGGTGDEELRDDHARYTHPGAYHYAFSLSASMA